MAVFFQPSLILQSPPYLIFSSSSQLNTHWHTDQASPTTSMALPQSELIAIWRFPKMGTPIAGWFIGKILQKWMIWGYPPDLGNLHIFTFPSVPPGDRLRHCTDWDSAPLPAERFLKHHLGSVGRAWHARLMYWIAWLPPIIAM